MSTTPAEQPMPPADKVFWVALTIFGAFFGGGLIMLFESGHWFIALGMTLAGLVGLLFLVRERWGELRYRNRIATAIRAIAQWIAPQNADAPALPDTLSSPDKIPPMRDALAVVFTPSPESLSELPWIEIITGGLKARHIDTKGRRPTKLRFVIPKEQVVELKDLPAIVPLGKGRLIIKQFTGTGVLIEEDNTVGDHAKAEIYFSDDAASAIVATPSPKPELPPTAGIPMDARANPFFAPVAAAPAPPTRETLEILFTTDGSPESLVWLKFLPDTPNTEQYPNRNGDAFLLILFGYRLLRNWDQVPIDHARGALAFSKCHFAQPDLREWVTPGPQLEPDLIALPYIRRGYIEKKRLASGGSFKLTPEGMQEATRLFQDMINRA